MLNQVNKQGHPIVIAFSVVGPWHVGPGAPNGSVCGQTQRYVTTYEVFIADYYGKGAKREMYKVTRIQFPDGGSTVTNCEQDGNEEQIDKVLKRLGVI